MIRCFQAFALVAGLIASAPALAGNLVVDAAPPAADSPSRAYATVFAGVSRSTASVELSEPGGDSFIAFGGDLNDGYIVGAALGTTLLPHLRGEVEFSIAKFNVGLVDDLPDEIESTGYNLLGNLWYDVETGTAFTPYVGGGAGWAYDVVANDLAEMYISGFTYQLGAGVRFAATDTIALDLGYRYRVRSHAEVTGDNAPEDFDVKISAETHIVQAGVSLAF